MSQALAAGALVVSFVLEVGRPVWPIRSELHRLVRVGAPIGVNWLLDIGGWAVLVAMLARVGTAEVAANMVAIRIVSVSFLPGHGLSSAAAILVGRYVGARRSEVAGEVLRSAVTLAAVVMGSFGLLFLLTPEPIVAVFSQDPEVIATGATLLTYAALFQLIDAVAMTTMGALNGAGDTAFTMKVGVIAGWGVLVPLGWLLAVRFDMGAPGVWLAITADVALRAAALVMRWRSGGWRGKEVV